MRNRTTAVFLVLMFLLSASAAAESRRDEAHRYVSVGPIHEGRTWALWAEEDAVDPWKEGVRYIIDTHGHRLTDGTVTVSDRAYSEGLVTVWKDGKAGCLDTAGNVAVPFAFDRIFEFMNGAAIARMGEKYGLIDRQGNWLLSCEWDDIFPLLPDRTMYVLKKNGVYSLANENGEAVSPCSFDYVSSYGFMDGLMLVGNEQGYGYVNTRGEMAIPCQWDAALDFRNGYAFVYTKDHEVGYIDAAGRLLFLLPEDWLINPDEVIRDGLLRVVKDGQYGYVDTDGALAISFRDWELADEFSEGRALVRRGGQYGYIDPTGAEVIPCQWDDARPFYKGYALVEKNGECQVIDREGNITAPLGKVYVVRTMNSDCRYKICEEKDGKNKYGLLRYDGVLITACQWDSIGWIGTDAWGSVEEIVDVSLSDGPDAGEKIGFIRLDDGKVIIPCEYDDGSYSEGYFSLIQNGYLTILDREGKIVF